MNYKEFFEHIEAFTDKQEKQKQRGLNDFNLLSTVRQYHDEVYLHSTMIVAFLNPKGLHYQSTLFLEKFLEILKLKDFDLNLEKTSVYFEYYDIDIYITDGNKHIVIENKIWAKDQPCQIIRYVNVIKEQYSLTVDDSQIPKINDMYVVYLTPNKKLVPDEHQVEDGFISFNGTNEKLQKCSKRTRTEKLVFYGLKNYQVKYKKINYQNDILNWLTYCQYEVQNITNLNEAIKQYKDVVTMVNHNYKEKVMSLSDELKKEQFFKIAYEVYSDFPKTCAKLELDFWNTLIEKVKHISGYIGIIDKTEGKIKDTLNTKIILEVRNSKGKKSEVNLYFEIIKDKVTLLIGTDNGRDNIYAVVHDPKWRTININETYVQKIQELNKSFQHKKWCFGMMTLNSDINLRNEELINAHNHIDKLAKNIKDLVTDLKEISFNS